MSYSFDYNNAAEVVVATSVGEIPGVGTVLGALTYIFWPSSGEDVWGEIRAQVEALINQKINDLVYEQVSDSLTGLQNTINDYTAAITANDLTVISAQWIATKTEFDQQLPSFQASGYEVLLLPLFAQYVNLYLALLRDGVLYGSTWGWNDAYLSQLKTSLSSIIPTFYNYAEKWYQTGLTNVTKSTKSNSHKCQPFRSVNAYVRQMNLTVLDFAFFWPYYDITKYPDPVTVVPSREIYSDPVGTCDNSGNINLESVPTGDITKIDVWAWDRIDAVQVTYPAGGGPGGVTTTARMGDKGGGSDSKHGGVFHISSSNPVAYVQGHAGDILNSMTLVFLDGTTSGQLGGAASGGSSFVFHYNNEYLTRIHINGISKFYGSADSAVFGYKFVKNQNTSVAASALYVSSPTTLTVSQVAASTKQNESTLAATAKKDNWDSQREAYQAHVQTVRAQSKAKTTTTATTTTSASSSSHH